MKNERPPSSLMAVLLVAREELRGSARDRQTLLYAVILPIALYPFLFWCMIQGSLFLEGRREHTPVSVGLASQRPAELPSGLATALERPSVTPDAPGEVDSPLEAVVIERARQPLTAEGARRWLEQPAASEGAESRPDAVLYLPAEESPESAERDAQIFFDSTDNLSALAERRVRERLAPFARTLRADRALEVGADPADLDPLTIELLDIAPKEDVGAYVLSFVLPVLLVVMAVMGAFFPAVDFTAGERERRTLETTLSLPVGRGIVHQGKILAVGAAAVVATTLNLTALALSAQHLLGMAGGGISVRLPLTGLLVFAPLALLFALFLSAVLTGVAALAKSFKEGQALLGPVQLIFIAPAMVGVLPGLELSPGLALVPVVNVVLLFRSLLQGQLPLLEYALTSLSLALFAALAVWLAVRILEGQSLRLSEGKLSLRSLVKSLLAPPRA